MSDKEIINYMMGLPTEYMAQYFATNSHKIEDDAVYWNVLGTLWKLGGTVVQQDLWLALFRDKRGRKHKIMKNRERKKWRKLPKIVTAYRSVNNESEFNTAISWTLSEEVAKNLFSENGEREVVSRNFNKSEIFAFFDRRQEDEIIVNV